MSSVAACVDRMRGTRSGQVRRVCRCVAAGVAVTLLVYVVLFVVAFRSATFAETDWMSSATGRLRPYGATVAERAGAFAHVATGARTQALTWIAALVSLPLVALSLIRRTRGLRTATRLAERREARPREAEDAAVERVPLRQAG